MKKRSFSEMKERTFYYPSLEKANLWKRKEPAMDDTCISLLGLPYQHTIAQAG